MTLNTNLPVKMSPYSFRPATGSRAMSNLAKNAQSVTAQMGQCSGYFDFSNSMMYDDLELSDVTWLTKSSSQPDVTRTLKARRDLNHCRKLSDVTGTKKS